ncbi:MAG: hypothetical protein IKX98_01900 [Clostridia bacterium]|nr:hypothetical protein [Clostridia bacterium]
MSKTCRMCGNAVPDEAKFCTECGNSEFIAEAAAAAQPQFVEQPAQPVYGGDNPSAAYGGSSPYTGEPANVQPAAQPYQQPAAQPQFVGAQQPYGPQQPYGQPQYAYGAAPAPKSNKKLIIAIIAIVLVLGLAAVAAFVWPGFLKGGSSALVGEWDGEYGDVMTINSDGTLKIDAFGATYDMTYELEGSDGIVVTGNGQTKHYTYTIEGDVLTFWEANADGGKDKVEKYVRKGGSSGPVDGPGVPADLIDTWVGEYDEQLVIHVDGTGEFNGEDFTYTVDGEKISMVHNGEIFEYTYEIDGDKLYFYDEDGIISESFYRYGTTPPSGYTGVDVEDEWYFNIDNVNYNDMYDAMIGAVLDTTGANEATRNMINDQKFKDSIRDDIGDFIERYYFDFRYDGTVHEIMSPEDYRNYVVSVNEASMDYVRDFTVAEAAAFYGTSEAEIQNYLNTNNLTWAEYVDQLKEANGPALREQFTDDAIAQMMGGTVNSYGEIEMDIGTFTQEGDTVTITGPAGDVTVLKFKTDDLMEVESITAPEGSSDAALSMLDSMDGLRFVRG